MTVSLSHLTVHAFNCFNMFTVGICIGNVVFFTFKCLYLMPFKPYLPLTVITYIPLVQVMLYYSPFKCVYRKPFKLYLRKLDRYLSVS